MPTLILLRHGQSQWNFENRFTGWVDVDLTATGEAEARKSGKLIAKEGIALDRCFTSVQTRAIRTSWLALPGGLPSLCSRDQALAAERASLRGTHGLE